MQTFPNAFRVSFANEESIGGGYSRVDELLFFDLRLFELDRSDVCSVVFPCLAGCFPGTFDALRVLGCANERPELHYRLIVLSRWVILDELGRHTFYLLFAFRDIHRCVEVDESRDHAIYVSINYCSFLIVDKGGNG